MMDPSVPLTVLLWIVVAVVGGVVVTLGAALVLLIVAWLFGPSEESEDP